MPLYRRLTRRELTSYPPTRRRIGYLFIVVVASITMYYQQYVAGAVAPSILAYFHISFRYYLTIIVISSVAGAVASLIAGLADRFGRANMVVGGLLLVSLVTAIGIPSAHSPAVYAVLASVVGFVEGMVLVATPALVRDFSPQAGRGAAMGFWTLGPVMGSLVVSEVSSNTLSHLRSWQDQFHIAGLTGLVVFVVALVFLRELSPPLRDQLMVSLRDRVLIEARVRGVDVESALEHPWRQMIRLDTVGPTLGVGVFLLIYYAAVGFFVIYFTTVFNFSQSQANGLGNWFWGADALAVVGVGLISDRIKVRKPFMIFGGIGAVILTSVFASRATQPATSYTYFIVLISLMSMFRGITYAPWMAAYTETVERHNPALVATGLAVFGWVLRIVAAISFLVLPFVVTSVTPVANYGPTLQAIEAQYPTQIATLRTLDPTTLAALQKGHLTPPVIASAVGEVVAHDHVTRTEALHRLLSITTIPKADRAYLQAHGTEVLSARQTAPGQWRTWWIVCVVGEILFLPTVFLLAGRWRPSRAREDAERHRAAVDRELAALATET